MASDFKSISLIPPIRWSKEVYMRGYKFKSLLVLLAWLAVISLALPCEASQGLQGKVMQVKDGDTVVISPVEDGAFFICRLYGIDAPETAKRNRHGQAYAADATQELKRLILGQTVHIELMGRRTHNREVCIIRKDSKDINLEMVRRGYAWAYVQFLKRPHASEYIGAEKEARSRRLGLWRDRNPMPPWEFRKKQRK
jgi:endonuclease YncB( thermonuclease family)